MGQQRELSFDNNVVQNVKPEWESCERRIKRIIKKKIEDTLIQNGIVVDIIGQVLHRFVLKRFTHNGLVTTAFPSDVMGYLKVNVSFFLVKRFENI